ncbi:DUF1203 domain-containing protein [Salinarimonas sp.]|uniref:DUF1203 domain-containing protein n=1 Tax=Salinarimonas sp. TaxID=2766526 RepID=UPI0032D997DF
MDFRVLGLSPEPFLPLYGLSEAALAERGVIRRRANDPTSYPDRIEMRHARPGESVLLLNHVSQPAASPYRASHAIYVREGASDTYDRVNAVPEVMRPRLLSVRAFDADGMIVDADVVEGADLEGLIARLLASPAAAYLHVHNAKRGCYAGRVERA